MWCINAETKFRWLLLLLFDCSLSRECQVDTLKVAYAHAGVEHCCCCASLAAGALESSSGSFFNSSSLPFHLPHRSVSTLRSLWKTYSLTLQGAPSVVVLLLLLESQLLSPSPGHTGARCLRKEGVGDLSAAVGCLSVGVVGCLSVAAGGVGWLLLLLWGASLSLLLLLWGASLSVLLLLWGASLTLLVVWSDDGCCCCGAPLCRCWWCG